MPEPRPSVERFFGKHAKDYSRSGSHTHGSDLAALIEALDPKKTETAVDVATGTGFTAFALAKKVKHVIGIDLTEEMLGQASRLARDQGITNVKFEEGEALELDYAAQSFDIVTTRRATHHFKDVPKFLGEARRVLRPGGRLGIVDMCPPEGAEAFMNRIEVLRDSSHVEAFSPEAWKSMISAAGLKTISSRTLDEPLEFGQWLYPVESGGTEEKAVRLAWESAPVRVKRLLHVRLERGIVKGWTKSRIILVASKTP